jgi:IclR family acetate operon transcriptional repressor
LSDLTPEKNSTTGGVVQAVNRCIDIFEQLVQADGELGISELSAATGLPAGTVHRLLSTLLARGYVCQNPKTRRYTLGYQVLALATRIHSREGVRAIARPYMRELMHITGETINLALLDGMEAVYVSQVQAPRIVRTLTEMGKRTSLHSTGIGKVLLAFQSPLRMEAILSKLELARYTSNTIVDSVRLREALKQIRQQGYALGREEYEEGIYCIAAPVLNDTAQAVAALSISGPANRLKPEKIHLFLPHLKRYAHNLSIALGYEPEAEPLAQPDTDSR